VAYLSADEAADRLSDRFNTTDGLPTEGDVDLASDVVDAAGPFIGGTHEYPQARAFPRSVTLPGDEEGAVPGRVLDATALIAYHLALSAQDEGGGAPVKSYTVGEMTFTYEGSSRSVALTRANALLHPYRLKTGVAS
jgi:hypothetical protein